MLLSDRIYAASFEALDIVAVSGFEWSENGDVARLQFVGRVGRQATEDDIVRKAKLQDFEGFVRTEAIADQYTRLTVSAIPRLRIEYLAKPFEAYLRVGISGFRVSVVPAGSRKRGPITPMSGSWPDDHRRQAPPVCTNALDGSHGRALDLRASVRSRVITAYEHLHRS
jgi:hypothetical protein